MNDVKPWKNPGFWGGLVSAVGGAIAALFGLEGAEEGIQLVATGGATLAAGLVSLWHAYRLRGK